MLRNVDLVKRNLNPQLEVSTIVCVMYDARTKLSDQVVQEVRDHFGDKVVRAVVPRSVRLSEAPSFGQPIIIFDPRSRGAIAYRDVATGGALWPGVAVSAKGLSSLIPPGEATPSGGDEAADPDRHPGRRHHAQPAPAAGALRRGVAVRADGVSIQQLGVLQPVLVRPAESGTGYELIAGERRWRAAGRAGLATIPALVRRTDDLAVVEQALVENLHRADLTPLEEAAAFQQLIDDFELTHEQIADRVGKSRSAITNTLRLLGLPPSIQHLLADGKLSAGHARALLATPDRALQEQLARQAVDEGWSVRMTEEAVKRGGAPVADDRRRPTGHADPAPTPRRRRRRAVHPPAPAGPARARGAARRAPRHARERSDGRQAGPSRDRLRRPRRPRAHLPPHDGRMTAMTWSEG